MKYLILTAALIANLSATAKVTVSDTVLFASVQEKEFKKIETTQVPADILKQASSRYNGYVLTEAYASEDAEYKLVMSKEGKVTKAYYKSNGEFIREEAK